MESKTQIGLMKLIRGMVLACMVMAAVLTAAPKAQAATANEKATFEFLTSHMGLSPAAACGIMGSIKAESNFTSNINGLGGAYGLCQWMGVRITRLKQFCASKGLDYTSLNGQLRFLEYETKTTFPAVYSHLKGVSNTAAGAYDAGYYWCYHFEVPADRHGASAYRASIARDTYWKEFGANAIYVKGAVVSAGVKLAWTGSSKYGFAVRRSEKSNSGFVTIGQTSGSVRTYTDTSVVKGHTYYYCIRPIKADGSLASMSNLISIKGKVSLTDEDCVIKLSHTEFTYNGKAQKAKVAVYYAGTKLRLNKDYTVSYANYVNAGKETVLITGKGNYSGKVKKTVLIRKAAQKITAKNAVYDLKSGRQVLRASAKGKVYFASGDKNYFVTKGNYLYTKKAGRAVLVVKAAATSNYAATTKKVWVYIRPSMPVVTAGNVSGLAIQAKWKAAGSPDGYQLRYMDTAHTSKLYYMELPEGKQTSTRIDGLIKGRTYTGRVRSYVLVGDKKLWSAWSKPVKTTIKK